MRFWEWRREEFGPYRFCKQLEEGELDAWEVREELKTVHQTRYWPSLPFVPISSKARSLTSTGKQDEDRS